MSDLVEIKTARINMLQGQIDHMRNGGKKPLLPGVTVEQQIAHWEKEIRKAEAMIKLHGKPEDIYPVSDWQYEVASGDTVLGYREWLQHKVEVAS